MEAEPSGADVGGRRVERVPADRTDRLEALLTGAGPHLERLLDVGTATNGDLLLVLPRPAARAGDLLGTPGWPSRGEAVTLLVPLAEALARMHAAGVAHGGVQAAAVVLDADGAPALAAPVAPVLRRRAGEAAFTAAVAEDLARYRTLVTVVLARARAQADLPDAADLAGTAEALFGVAEPVPLALAPAPVPAPTVPPGRLTPPREAEEAAPGPALRLAHRLAASARSVRRRIWIAAGAAVTLLLVALLVLPETGAEAGPGPGAADTAEPAPREEAPVVVARSLEPVDAVRALLVARADCLARSDARCLRTIEAEGSPVTHADAEAIRAGSEAVRADPDALRLLGQGGGTATVTAGDAVVLAVREPDGWRLRDVVTEPPVG